MGQNPGINDFRYNDIPRFNDGNVFDRTQNISGSDNDKINITGPLEMRI